MEIIGQVNVIASMITAPDSIFYQTDTKFLTLLKFTIESFKSKDCL